MIVRKQVTPEGTVPGLENMAGEEVILIRARTKEVAKAMEKPLMVVDDLRRFMGEHRDLMLRQVREFNARYGNPADKALEYAKHLNAEEVKSRVHELNDLVEKRLEAITKDLEKRYEDLEREVEGTVEKLFAATRKTEDAPTTPVDAAASQAPAATGATGASESGKPAKAKRRADSA